MKDKYLKILQDKEREAEQNYVTDNKKALQSKMILAAAKRERISFEEGLKQ